MTRCALKPGFSDGPTLKCGDKILDKHPDHQQYADDGGADAERAGNKYAAVEEENGDLDGGHCYTKGLLKDKEGLAGICQHLHFLLREK